MKTSQQTFRKYIRLGMLGNAYSPRIEETEDEEQIQTLSGIGSEFLSSQKEEI